MRLEDACQSCSHACEPVHTGFVRDRESGNLTTGGRWRWPVAATLVAGVIGGVSGLTGAYLGALYAREDARAAISSAERISANESIRDACLRSLRSYDLVQSEYSILVRPDQRDSLPVGKAGALFHDADSAMEHARGDLVEWRFLSPNPGGLKERADQILARALTLQSEMSHTDAQLLGQEVDPEEGQAAEREAELAAFDELSDDVDALVGLCRSESGLAPR